MISKLNQLIKNDELLLHKIGLVVGTMVGILIGGVITKRADEFEALPDYEIIDPEEATNGQEEN
jgi:hypothetical protein